MAAWLAPRTRATTRSLHGREQLARGMDRRWQVVGAGVAAGTVSLAQAEVIVRALETLDAPAVGERVDRELLGDGRTTPGARRPPSSHPRRYGRWVSGSWK